MKSSTSSVRLDRNLVDLRSLNDSRAVDFLERIEAWLRGLDGAFDLLLMPDFADREVAPAIPLQRVRRIEDALDLLVSN